MTSISTYSGIDPVYYCSAPGWAWDCMLHRTGVHLTCIKDPDKFLFFEASKRGGLAVISHRKAVANNKYMKERYNPSEPTSWIVDWDANNLVKFNIY